MLVSDLVPNEFTFSSVLQSCSSLEDFVLGICIQIRKIKRGFELNPVLGSAFEIFKAMGCGDENYIPAIAIVGRPNVGKSIILNALVGEDRTIVSPISGTTRDAIDTEVTRTDGQKFKLIDTAGIRRRAVVVSSGSPAEALSVNRALWAIRRADVVALVIEALACITGQDYKIAERIEREGKGCVIFVNKWDTIPNNNLGLHLGFSFLHAVIKW
ncbi:hypothetical protein IFM89_011234 [Coptis chinensis]|uniref:G domain-containing protein n=1 Tax=Coptis chinensis TaxID=261450 RepID=A0A835HKK1_9MAGN|nr:hypothetical protein IFM89_011234 [Coptis chinensis]